MTITWTKRKEEFMGDWKCILHLSNDSLGAAFVYESFHFVISFQSIYGLLGSRDSYTRVYLYTRLNAFSRNEIHIGIQLFASTM